MAGSRLCSPAPGGGTFGTHRLWSPSACRAAGAKKQPFYHIVATDSRARRDGRYIERLGYYNPVARGDATPLDVNLERLDYWVANGAQMSERGHQDRQGPPQGGTRGRRRRGLSVTSPHGSPEASAAGGGGGMRAM